jgi:UDP-N-acetylmuramate--alanine ligase
MSYRRIGAIILNSMNPITELPSDLKNRHIHLVGIKGTGMAALTEILCARGAHITGSDIADTFYTDALLKKLDITPLLFSPQNITAGIESGGIDLVIYSAAYNFADNSELAEAKKRNIPCVSYPEALGLVSRGRCSSGIAGVHGKTTTPGLAGTILQGLGLNAQTLAGSSIASFSPDSAGGACTVTGGTGAVKYFVAETCEYQRNFMYFSPSVVVLTSVESDHQDFFPTFADIQTAFVDYCLKLPQGGSLIYCADDAGAAETAAIVAAKRSDIERIPYGETANGDFRVAFGDIRGGKQFFRLAGYALEFALIVPGKHFVLNAAAGIALATVLLRQEGKNSADIFSKSTAQKIADSLLRFTGAKRRSEIIGEVGDTVFIDDYAHHPTAITKTLEGFRSFYPERRLIVDFMSHTYSRTQALFGEFASAFGEADTVILHKIYASAREAWNPAFPTGTSLAEEICKHHSDVHYFEEVDGAFDFARGLLADKPDPQYPNGKLFVTMGAGDNWKLGVKLFECASRSQLSDARSRA